MIPTGMLRVEGLAGVVACQRCQESYPLRIREIGVVCAVCLGDAFSLASASVEGRDAVWDRTLEIYLGWRLTIEHDDTVAIASRGA